MFKRFKKCKHEYESIGLFYKEKLTEYRNCFDIVCAYERLRCNKCGDIKDILLTSESFIPEMHQHRDKRKDEYIKYLKSKGFVTEIDLYTYRLSADEIKMMLEKQKDNT